MNFLCNINQSFADLLINYLNLPNELKSNVKLFADDTSLFTIIKDKNESANCSQYLPDLLLISKWAFNWKMLSNPDPSKPAQEFLFPRKTKVQNHPAIIFKLKERLIKNI